MYVCINVCMYVCMYDDVCINVCIVFRFPDFSLVEVSAGEIWTLFTEDLRSGLAVHANKKITEVDDYINLQFKVKYLWNHYVAQLKEYKNVIPGYSK